MGASDSKAVADCCGSRKEAIGNGPSGPAQRLIPRMPFAASKGALLPAAAAFTVLERDLERLGSV
jgi:hypothetical protein